MANDVRVQLEGILARFSEELLALFKLAVSETLVTGKPAAAPKAAAPKRGAKPKAAPAPKGRRGPKSTPAEVKVLAQQIMDVLQKAPGPLSAADIQNVLKVDSGQFHYALNKLKISGTVAQQGQRRMARYSVGGGKRGKRGK